MNPDHIQLLCNIHSCLVDAARLPEGSRPYGVQGRLDDIEKQIMEALKTSKPPTTNDDNIPF